METSCYESVPARFPSRLVSLPPGNRPHEKPVGSHEELPRLELSSGSKFITPKSMGQNKRPPKGLTPGGAESQIRGNRKRKFVLTCDTVPFSSS